MAFAFWSNASRSSTQRYHTVKQGQTLSSIARRYRVSVWDLALSNHTHPKEMLRAGQTLSVPPRGVTYVRPGQTLSQIARVHNCSTKPDLLPLTVSIVDNEGQIIRKSSILQDAKANEEAAMSDES